MEQLPSPPEDSERRMYILVRRIGVLGHISQLIQYDVQVACRTRGNHLGSGP